jgi:hypothetical protein
MSIKSRMNDKRFVDQEFDHTHYIDALYALIAMNLDRMELYLNDKYLQEALRNFNDQLFEEISQIEESKPSFMMMRIYSQEEIESIQRNEAIPEQYLGRGANRKRYTPLFEPAYPSLTEESTEGL